MEELVTVAIPLYGDAPLSAEETRALLHPKLSKSTRSDAEVREVLEDAAAIPDRNASFVRAIETRRQTLAAERKSMLDRMRRHNENDGLAPWLNGLDDISPGTFDVLTVTILFSEG